MVLAISKTGGKNHTINYQNNSTCTQCDRISFMTTVSVYADQNNIGYKT